MWPKLTTVLALLSAVSISLTEARTAGCGKNPPSGGVKSINVNGQNRQYTLTLPGGYNSNTAYKFIIGYHWLNGNMGNVVSGGYYGLQSRSQNTAIFVAPEGLNAGWANNNGQDIAFTDAILAQIFDQLCVDETNVFATGFSYGGAMTYSAACSRPDVFKAVAVIAGAQLSGCSGSGAAVPYLGIHGSADNVLPIASGRQLRDRFIGLNGCQTKNAGEPGAGSNQVIRTDYSCRAGYPVTWIAHGGGHIGDPSFAPDETWKFFTQEGLKGGGGGGGSSSSSAPPSQSTTMRTSTTTSAPSQPTGGACSARYEQCGGQNWSGPKCCQSGTTCKFSNDWYSQCL
ncbi:fungal cellulose binding domain-containing protein [Sarocladium implicatum]|nr:fungal cellulose binding domain-containing protein [Sarocladium implicatum]